MLAALDEPARSLDDLGDVGRARVERREAEADRVWSAEVRDDARALDQGAADAPRLLVSERDVRAAPGRVARRAEREAERCEPLVVELDRVLGQRSRVASIASMPASAVSSTPA